MSSHSSHQSSDGSPMPVHARKKQRLCSSSASIPDTDSLHHGSIAAQLTRPSLYTDVIHSILRFLVLDDFLIVTQLNHTWKASIRTLRPRLNAKIVLTSENRMKIPKRTSAMIPHVTTVDIASWRNLHPQAQLSRLFVFPLLESIEDMIIPLTSRISHLEFPTTLTAIDLHVGCNAFQQVLDLVCAVLQLKCLCISCSDYEVEMDAATINFNPLLQLTVLEELSVRFPSKYTKMNIHGELNPCLVAFLTTASRVSSLLLLDFEDDKLNLSHLDILTDRSSQLHRLQKINTDFYLNDSCATLLKKLPSLTDLSPDFCSLEDVSFLLSFSNLVKLDLIFLESDSEFIPEPANIIQSMAHLVTLEHLTLVHPTIDGDELKQLFTPLVRLNTFKGELLYNVQDLSAFESGSITKTLTSLALNYCYFINPFEAWKIYYLRNLQELTLTESFNAPLRDCEKLLFKRLIPHLKVFTYTYKDEDDNDDE